MWRVTGYVGYFHDGGTVDLGSYRWWCAAQLAALVWLARWRYSRAVIRRA